MNLSLHTRLLAGASLVLLVFFGLTGLVLDQAFRDSAESATRERLQTQVYVLLAAAEVDAGIMLFMPDDLPDPRLALARSGLYAQIEDREGTAIWRSASLLGKTLAVDSPVTVGETTFRHTRLTDGTEVFVLSYGVSWQSGGGQQRYTFRVAETLDGYYTQIGHFRRSLSVWLIAAALVLLALQGTILRWSLSPLRQVADDLQAIESGQATELTGIYPRELTGLTTNLNHLIRSSHALLKRYRDSLGNLAHSLKTPLAVMRNATEMEMDIAKLKRTTREQVQRMSQLVDHQLNRAATSGTHPLAAPVSVKNVIEKIVSALSRASRDKPVQVDQAIDASVRFYGNEDDLYELMGNLLENAFKWCDRRVRVKAANPPDANAKRSRLSIVVEDDGPGIAESERDAVLGRGKRGDETVPGHGIGLAIVSDIVDLYGGEIAVSESALGGASIQLTL